MRACELRPVADSAPARVGSWLDAVDRLLAHDPMGR